MDLNLQIYIPLQYNVVVSNTDVVYGQNHPATPDHIGNRMFLAFILVRINDNLNHHRPFDHGLDTIIQDYHAHLGHENTQFFLAMANGVVVQPDGPILKELTLQAICDVYDQEFGFKYPRTLDNITPIINHIELRSTFLATWPQYTVENLLFRAWEELPVRDEIFDIVLVANQTAEEIQLFKQYNINTMDLWTGIVRWNWFDTVHAHGLMDMQVSHTLLLEIRDYYHHVQGDPELAPLHNFYGYTFLFPDTIDNHAMLTWIDHIGYGIVEPFLLPCVISSFRKTLTSLCFNSSRNRGPIWLYKDGGPGESFPDWYDMNALQQHTDDVSLYDYTFPLLPVIKVASTNQQSKLVSEEVSDLKDEKGNGKKGKGKKGKGKKKDKESKPSARRTEAKTRLKKMVRSQSTTESDCIDSETKPPARKRKITSAAVRKNNGTDSGKTTSAATSRAKNRKNNEAKKKQGSEEIEEEEIEFDDDDSSEDDDDDSEYSECSD